MASGISTVTSRWQVTLPEGARKGIPVKAGQRVLWEAKEGYWEVRPLPDLAELSGCLKADRPPLTDAALRSLVREAKRKNLGRTLGGR